MDDTGKKKIPEFKDFDEMQKWMEREQKKTTGKKTIDKKKRKQYSDPTPKVDDSDIYRTTHFYTRNGDNFNQVLRDSRQELERCGPGSRVMAHDHLFTETCSPSCRSVS